MHSKAGTQDVKWCPQAGPVGVLVGVLVGVFVRGRVFVCLFPGACSFGCVGVSVWLCVGVSVWLCVGVLVGVRAFAGGAFEGRSPRSGINPLTAIPRRIHRISSDLRS